MAAPAQSSCESAPKPNPTTDNELEWPLDLDQARDDIEYSLELAEDERVYGNLSTAEKILLSCYEACVDLGPSFDVYRLDIAIGLGDLYFSHKAWARAVQQYKEAWQIWDSDEHVADNVSPPFPILSVLLKLMHGPQEERLHPTMFLTNFAECCENLGSPMASNMRAKAEQFVALYEADRRQQQNMDD